MDGLCNGISPLPSPASLHVSAEEEALPLLQVASQRELAFLSVFDGLEVWPTCRLDGIDELRGSGAGQERGRDGQAEVLLHYTVTGTDCAVLERVQARPARGDVEELSALVPGATGDNGGATSLLHR